MERRSSARLFIESGLVALGSLPDVQGSEGWPLRDFSEGGMRFEMSADHPSKPENDDIIDIVIEPFGEKDTLVRQLALKGVVRHTVAVDDSPENNAVDISVEFLDLSDDDKEQLAKTVLDIAIENIERLQYVKNETPTQVEASSSGERIGDILVSEDVLSRGELESFISDDFDGSRPLGRQLVESGLASETDVASAIAQQSDLPFVDLRIEGVNLLMLRHFDIEVLEQNLFIPLHLEPERVTIAVGAPLDPEILELIEERYSRPIKQVVASERQLVSAIQKAFYVTRNRRSDARLSVGLSVRYMFYDANWKRLSSRVAVGLTKNLSRGGLLFVGPLPSEAKSSLLGSEVTNIGMHLVVPEHPEPVRVACEVIRVTPVVGRSDAEGEIALFGVKLLGISDADRTTLNIFRMSAYMHRPLFQSSWAVQKDEGKK